MITIQTTSAIGVLPIGSMQVSWPLCETAAVYHQCDMRRYPPDGRAVVGFTGSGLAVTDTPPEAALAGKSVWKLARPEGGLGLMLSREELTSDHWELVQAWGICRGYLESTVISTVSYLDAKTNEHHSALFDVHESGGEKAALAESMAHTCSSIETRAGHRASKKMRQEFGAAIKLGEELNAVFVGFAQQILHPRLHVDGVWMSGTSGSNRAGVLLRQAVHHWSITPLSSTPSPSTSNAALAFAA